MAKCVGKYKCSFLRHILKIEFRHVSLVQVLFFRYYFGRRTIVLLAEPDLIKQVMVKEFSSFTNRSVSISEVYQIFLIKITTRVLMYFHIFLSRRLVFSASPLKTLYLFWGTNNGREFEASWLRPSVLPRWKKWDNKYLISEEVAAGTIFNISELHLFSFRNSYFTLNSFKDHTEKER